MGWGKSQNGKGSQIWFNNFSDCSSGILNSGFTISGLPLGASVNIYHCVHGNSGVTTGHWHFYGQIYWVAQCLILALKQNPGTDPTILNECNFLFIISDRRQHNIIYSHASSSLKGSYWHHSGLCNRQYLWCLVYRRFQVFDILSHHCIVLDSGC